MKGRTELEHPEWNNACYYQEYVVAFLDVLGFSQLVNNTKYNVVFAGLFNAINNGIAEDNFIKQQGFEGLKTSILSDTVVFSLRANTDKLFEKLNRLLFMVLTSFAEENIFLRGAITKGLLYHEDSIVFGPALVRAYKLESEVAVYPRCILDSTIIDDLANGLSHDELDLLSNFTKDTDGYKFFDIFHILMRNSSNDQQHIITLRRMRDVIMYNLEKYKTPRSNYESRIRDKYIWCQHAYNSAAKHWKIDKDLII